MTNFKGFHCSPGYYCPAGSTSATQVACAQGSYSDSYEIFDQSQCLVCPRGFKCGLATTSSTMVSCPKNQYCPEGTRADVTVNCRTGTYAPYTNSKSMEDCIPCPFGQYCLAGSDPVSCPKGSYCPESTEYANQYPCAAGTYLDYTGGMAAGECKPCGPGNYCPLGSAAQVPCDKGYYNNFTNFATQCLICPAGSYCPQPGTTTPQKCVAGKYSALGSTKCTYCEVGYYCPLVGTTDTLKALQLCPVGKFCSRSVSTTETDPDTLATVIISGTFGLAVYPNLRDHAC